MADLSTIILILCISLGLIAIALAVPLIRRRIGPNPLYGFRVRRTLDDPEIWYEANAFAGRSLFWFGIGTSLGSLALYFFSALDPVAYVLSCTLITLVGLAVSVILSFRYLDRLTR